MATRLPEPEPWTRVAAVLAEAAGVDESRSFDAEARALAKTMRGVRHDWAGWPCITWSMATELLESLQAEAAARRAAIEERLVAADQVRMAALPRGIPASEIPPGASPAAWLMATEPVPAGRVSVLEDALAGSGTIFHPIIRDEQADQ
jgi:hypothetical protein